MRISLKHSSLLLLVDLQRFVFSGMSTANGASVPDINITLEGDSMLTCKRQ